MVFKLNTLILLKLKVQKKIIFSKMFMRRQLKQGKMFQLGKNNNQPDEQSDANTFGTISSTQLDEDHSMNEVQYQPPNFTNFRDFNVEQIASQNNIAVMCCGAIMCFLCSAIGIGLFYFFIFDYVRDYVPFLSSSKYLTELNAKQYFAVNPMYAGQFHFPRVPVEYWSHRIDMAKSMGLNALSVYVFWNYHQIEKGKFDFETKSRNLTYFLQLCKEKDMKVLLRPGPYVCAEWDFGGLPTRLLTMQGMKIRSSNDLFIEETKVYFEQLSKVIEKYILNRNNPDGPILMMQVQNEPAWYTDEVLYITKLKQLWDNIGLNCPLYFDDTTNGLKNSTLYWQNAIIGMNPSWYKGSDFDIFKDSNHFVFGGQVYAGWFMSWGEAQSWKKNMIIKYTTRFAEQFSDMLHDNRSFSIYMVHGGTNFGQTAAFNLITSYDYWAPITQQGRPGPNYHAFRSILVNYKDVVLPKIPEPIQTFSLTFGKLTPSSSFLDNLPDTIQYFKEPLVFESQQLKMYQQGLVLYETTIKGPMQYTFQVIFHDMSFIFIDGKFDKTVSRKNAGFSQQKQDILIECKKKQCKLQILVEALGHKNFGHQMSYDKKGILHFIDKKTNESLNTTWSHYRFDVSEPPKWKNIGICNQAPCLYQIQVNIDNPKDTFINVKQLKKGYVWVNGHSLGRYWDLGPQYSLYCPGVWLKNGNNKISVLDLYETDSNVTLKGQQFMLMDPKI